MGAVISDKERAENFPVALRVLPAALRADLRAIYAVVRTIDDLGDEAVGDRAALLHDFATDLKATFAGQPPQAQVLSDLLPTIFTRQLTAEPFESLIAANLADQQVSRYDSLEDVLGYCRLSAAPIGRLVLQVFGQSSPTRCQLSDQVCSALQLLEHWQDVGEDRRAGRIYLPRADMDRFGVTEHELDQPSASPALRQLVLFETDRAAGLLESGPPLIGQLTGWAKLAVSGYLAGGQATVDALRRADGDVLRVAVRPRRRDLLRHLLAQLRPHPLGGRASTAARDGSK